MTIHGQAMVQLRLADSHDEVAKVLATQNWYFSPATGLPTRVEYRVPGTRNASEFVDAAAEFSEYRVTNGVMVPFSITIYRDAVADKVITINSLHINPPLTPSDFEAELGGAQ